MSMHFTPPHLQSAHLALACALRNTLDRVPQKDHLEIGILLKKIVGQYNGHRFADPAFFDELRQTFFGTSPAIQQFALDLGFSFSMHWDANDEQRSQLYELLDKSAKMCDVLSNHVRPRVIPERIARELNSDQADLASLLRGEPWIVPILLLRVFGDNLEPFQEGPFQVTGLA